MVRKHFSQRIEGLRDELLNLGQSVEQSTTRSIQSLRERNTTIANWVVENDKQIDEARYTLEERVVTLLSTQQPVVAHDLRVVIAVTAIATELERVGDYANGIARRVVQHAAMLGQISWPEKIDEMARRAQHMLHMSMDAFLNEDVEQARELGQLDDHVDALRDELRHELLAQAHNDSQTVDAVVEMLEVVSTLERIADRATNIGERIIYIVTSEIEEINM